MNSFFSSTQYKNWIKTEDQLAKIETLKFSKILKRINIVNALIKIENIKLIEQHNADKNNQSSPPPKLEQYISTKRAFSLTDEKFLIINYSNKIITMMNTQKHKSSSLKNLTITYFRRFYLKKSILDYDPDFLMPAALYLAAKISSINYSRDDFIKIFSLLKSDENWEKLYNYEFYLCTILDYEFFVYNPYQALLGFIYSLEQKEFFLAQDKDNYIDQEDFKNECMNLIDKMYLTDNIFLFTYSEIALASIIIQCEQKNVNIFNIAEKLGLDKAINIKEFLEIKVSLMKKKISEIPKVSIKEGNEKSKHILKNINRFLNDFPKYQAELNKERKELKGKMNNFEINFAKFEPKIQKK